MNVGLSLSDFQHVLCRRCGLACSKRVLSNWNMDENGCCESHESLPGCPCRTSDSERRTQRERESETLFPMVPILSGCALLCRERVTSSLAGLKKAASRNATMANVNSKPDLARRKTQDSFLRELYNAFFKTLQQLGVVLHWDRSHRQKWRSRNRPASLHPAFRRMNGPSKFQRRPTDSNFSNASWHQG